MQVRKNCSPLLLVRRTVLGILLSSEDKKEGWGREGEREGRREANTDRPERLLGIHCMRVSVPHTERTGRDRSHVS